MGKGDVSCDTRARLLAHVRTANPHVIKSAAASVPTGVYGVAKPRNRAEQTEISLPPGCRFLSVSDGLHRRTANTSKHTCGASVSLQGPRYSGSKPQTRFSRGDELQRRSKFRQVDALRPRKPASPLEQRGTHLRASSLNCSGASRTHSHAHGISRHACEQIEHPKHAGCLVPSCFSLLDRPGGTFLYLFSPSGAEQRIRN